MIIATKRNITKKEREREREGEKKLKSWMEGKRRHKELINFISLGTYLKETTSAYLV